MFSPIVSWPLMQPLGTGQYFEYCVPSCCVAALNFVSVSGVHQLRVRPASSKARPWSSKPWPISWPMTPPIAP